MDIPICKKLYELTGCRVAGRSCKKCPGCDSEKTKEFALRLAKIDSVENQGNRKTVLSHLAKWLGYDKAIEVLGIPRPERFPTVALIIGCQGRLDHLKTTLETLVNSGPAITIVVDASDPDRSGQWAGNAFPGQVEPVWLDCETYPYSRVFNVGAVAAVELLPNLQQFVFCDADVAVKPSLCRQVVEAGHAAVRIRQNAHGNTVEPRGLIACPVKEFFQVGGFEEAFDPWWGCRDADLLNRMMKAGLPFKEILGIATQIPNIPSYEELERSKRICCPALVSEKIGWSVSVRLSSGQTELRWPCDTGC